jgi:hypothetical protein
MQGYFLAYVVPEPEETRFQCLKASHVIDPEPDYVFCLL